MPGRLEEIAAAGIAIGAGVALAATLGWLFTLAQCYP